MVVVIGKFATGSCVLVGTLGFKIKIFILSLSATQEALVILLLDHSPYVSVVSCVIVESIGELPTGSCVSVGNMEISVVITSIV